MAGARTYPAQAIVLHQTKLRETDLILTLLSSDGSQIRAVAKGARKGGGRFAARVGLFCESSFLIAKGKTLDIVQEAQLMDAHARLREIPEMMFAASQVTELAQLMCYEDIKDPFMYAITRKALSSLEAAPDAVHLDLIVSAYAWKVLAHGGWRPELGGCTCCGDAEASFFSSEMGGLVCASCVGEVAGAHEIKANDIAWLRALLGRTFDELLGDAVDRATASALFSLAREWAETQLDARLRSFSTTFEA